MKVIIEISEKLFNAVKERCADGFCGSDVWESVAAGVPYPQGEWIEPIKTLFNKYDVLLVHEGGQIVPVKNTTKQDCYDLLYEIQELIEWRKILFNKNLNDIYKEGGQNA